jgi:hypothetical protein
MFSSQEGDTVGILNSFEKNLLPKSALQPVNNDDSVPLRSISKSKASNSYRDLCFLLGFIGINIHTFCDKCHTIPQCMQICLQCGCAEILTQSSAYMHIHSVSVL